MLSSADETDLASLLGITADAAPSAVAVHDTCLLAGGGANGK
jgi:hypothetical protein